MSNNGDEERPEPGKTFPLDLASKIGPKALDCKTSVVVTGQPLRNMRVLTQTPGQPSVVSPAIIAANLVPQAVIKQCGGIINASQAQTSGTLQRPAQITIATPVPVVTATLGGTQNTYHVPRGPAVVANLAAPRSNVAAAIRAPLVVTAQGNQTQSFTRPPRTPSPAQGTAWLTTSSTNGSQIKGAPTVLSSPVRGASVTGALNKQQLLTKTQNVTSSVPSMRPTTILHSAITIGQGAQLHSYKSAQPAAGIQALGNTVTLTQVLPARTQALVYSAGGNGTQFTTTPRLTVASTMQNRQVTTAKPIGQVTTARLAMPIGVSQPGATRLVTPQGTVLTTGARLANVSPSQPTIIGTTPARIVPTTQSNVTLGRLSVSVPASSLQVTNPNVLGQARISTLSLHPVVAVANNNQPRAIQQTAKVITQTMPANTIHLPQLPAVIKPAATVTTSARTINLQPANIVTQRPITSGAAQAVSISKVFSQQIENQQPTTNIFIHAPIAPVPRKTSPGPAVITQTTSAPPTPSVTTYSLASGAYFYDAAYSVARPFNQQSSFAAVPQAANQQSRTTSLNAQVHNLVTNQAMRFNPVMVVDQNRLSQFSQQQQQQQQQQEMQDSSQHVVTSSTKITSSPRPSILRKRDNEGMLKAAKNLNPQLGILTSQAPISPPSRPDSGENGNSSGGSTTLSATSSPGIVEPNDDSLLNIPMNTMKDEEENIRPPLEISPRKKPRKQQLTGNDLDDNLNEDMQFISESNIKKEADSDSNHSDNARDDLIENQKPVQKPATRGLLNSYKQTWKATHNHYLRHADVRPKDERRPTIMDLSNQHRVLDKVNGWKIHHLSTQMEDLADQEQNVYNQLTEILKDTEGEQGNGFETEINRINELIKGNMQRIKIINDGMIEAKSQIMKIFDHKVHVLDIINRCASKRNFKKREKS